MEAMFTQLSRVKSTVYLRDDNVKKIVGIGHVDFIFFLPNGRI